MSADPSGTFDEAPLIRLIDLVGRRSGPDAQVLRQQLRREAVELLAENARLRIENLAQLKSELVSLADRIRMLEDAR